MVPIGEIIELAYGKSLPAKRRKRGAVAVYGSNGLAGYHDEALVSEPTIIVGRKGSAGSVHVTDGPSFPIDTTFFVRPRGRGAYDLKYMKLALERADLKRLAITTGVPGLNREDAYRERIPLPPLDEQRRIVEVLERAAGIRRRREQALDKARALIPALFLDMFGDPATNPKGWQTQPLGGVIAGFQGGRNLAAGNGTADGIRILRVSAVTSGAFNPAESKPAPDGYEPPPEHFVQRGDLLISRANTVDLVGAVALVDKHYENVLLPDKIWRFLWKKPSSVEPEFVAAYFRTSAARTALRVMATGTSDSMRNISQRKLLRLPIPLPCFDLQRAFAERVADIRAIIAPQERSLDAARALERSLMARLLG